MNGALTIAAAVLLASTLAYSSDSLAIEGSKLQPIQEIFEPVGEYESGNFGKVAVVQWAPPTVPLGVTEDEAEAFKQGNRKILAGYIRQAAKNGAKLVITPEFGVLGYPDLPGVPPEEDEYRDREDIRPYVEPVPGPTTKYFSKLARELRVTIHVGFAEVDKKTDAYYNTVVAINSRGRVAAKYRKINLYAGEEHFLSAGTEPVIYKGPYGKVGIIVCADVYSPFPMDSYRESGVTVLALSTSWAQMNTGMSVFREGAKWVGAHVLAANQIYFPDSGVINPDGSVQSHIRQSEGLAYGYLPRAKRGPK